MRGNHDIQGPWPNDMCEQRLTPQHCWHPWPLIKPAMLSWAGSCSTNWATEAGIFMMGRALYILVIIAPSFFLDSFVGGEGPGTGGRGIVFHPTEKDSCLFCSNQTLTLTIPRESPHPPILTLSWMGGIECSQAVNAGYLLYPSDSRSHPHNVFYGKKKRGIVVCHAEYNRSKLGKNATIAVVICEQLYGNDLVLGKKRHLKHTTIDITMYGGTCITAKTFYAFTWHTKDALLVTFHVRCSPSLPKYGSFMVALIGNRVLRVRHSCTNDGKSRRTKGATNAALKRN